MTQSPTHGIPFSSLLIMAVAVHGLSADAIQKKNIIACGRPILRQALFWLGCWNEQTRFALYSEMDDQLLNELYQTLIQMTRDDTPLISGFGNLGEGGLPPSYPTYVAFGLTQSGHERAAKLFARYPELRDPEPIPDKFN